MATRCQRQARQRQQICPILPVSRAQHDYYQYWSPISVDENGIVAEMGWVNEFHMEIGVPALS